MTRTLTSTIGAFLVLFGIGITAQRFLDIDFTYTLPIQLIILGIYMAFVPYRKIERKPVQKILPKQKGRKQKIDYWTFPSTVRKALNEHSPLILFLTILPVSSFIFHIWTTYVAFSEGGFMAGILTLFFPFIGEIYWMIKIWGENDMYMTFAVVHFVGWLFYVFVGRQQK